MTLQQITNQIINITFIDKTIQIFRNEFHYIIPKYDIIATRRRVDAKPWNHMSINEFIDYLSKFNVKGSKNSRDYLQLSFGNKKCLRHRYIYEIHHGITLNSETPIDHINRLKWDNRISNLRLSNHTLNNQNKNVRSDNRTGRKGITIESKNGECNYTASLTYKGKTMKLIRTKNLNLATAMYNMKAKQMNREYNSNYSLIKVKPSERENHGRHKQKQMIYHKYKKSIQDYIGGKK